MRNLIATALFTLADRFHNWAIDLSAFAENLMLAGYRASNATSTLPHPDPCPCDDCSEPMIPSRYTGRQEICMACHRPTWNGLVNGACYACDEAAGYAVTPEKCLACPRIATASGLCPACEAEADAYRPTPRALAISLLRAAGGDHSLNADDYDLINQVLTEQEIRDINRGLYLADERTPAHA